MYDPPSPTSNTATSELPGGKVELEKSGHVLSYDDPFCLRTGYLSQQKLSQLLTNSRKNGKKLQAYHRKQNQVFIYFHFI